MFKPDDVSVLDALILTLVGIAFCVLWLRGIQSYADLNSGKFEIILSLERLLGSKPFFAEWEVLERGSNAVRYVPFRIVEALVPKLFILLFVILFLREVSWMSIFQAGWR